jgi:hypothetical protein
MILPPMYSSSHFEVSSAEKLYLCDACITLSRLLVRKLPRGDIEKRRGPFDFQAPTVSFKVDLT